jgi:hypothetical protein
MKTAEEILKEKGLGVSRILSIKGEYSTIDAMNEYASLVSSSKEARIKELEEGLNTIISYNLQEAQDRYGDKTKAEQWACVVAARKALNPPTDGMD